MEHEEESPDEDDGLTEEDGFNSNVQGKDGFVALMSERDSEEVAFDDIGFPVSTR